MVVDNDYNAIPVFIVPLSVQESSTANYCGSCRIGVTSITAVTIVAKNASITTEDWMSTSNKVRARSTYGAIPIK